MDKQNHKKEFDYHVSDLSVDYNWRGRSERAVHNVSFGLQRGWVTAIIGESGSGKTTIARALLGCLPDHAIVTVRENRLPKRLAFIQQEAHSSLHPMVSVGNQVNDCLAATKGLGVKAAQQHTLELFGELGLTPATLVYHRYAQQLSGGQAQRVALARALAMEAELLIADEPTSQLDLISQAEAVRAIDKVTRSRQMSTLFITHDLALVAELADWLLVLQKGEVVETGAVAEVWKNPKHPYTRHLLGELSDEL